MKLAVNFTRQCWFGNHNKFQGLSAFLNYHHVWAVENLCLALFRNCKKQIQCRYKRKSGKLQLTV